MNESALHTLGWTKQPDGSWDGVINGISYLIDKQDGRYYIYRKARCEHIDTAPDLITAIQLVSKRESIDHV